MTDFLKLLRREVEQEVKLLELPQSPKNLYEPMHYMLELGGKRIRPILTLMACELLGKSYKAAMPQALAVEIFHNFTLVHDDIMDSAPLRRGQATVHKKWDHNIALLSGDGMMIVAYQHLFQADAKKLKALAEVFNETALLVCEGQQFDMDYAENDSVTIDQYMNMIRLKTAVLLGGAMQLGAIIADASLEKRTTIDDFAVNLGIAFQLRDDYLDSFGDSASFGKTIGGDIKEGKRTWLTIKAFEKADDECREKLTRAFDELEGEDRVKEVMQCYDALGIQALVEKEIKQFSQRSRSALNALEGEMETQKQLEWLVDYLMGRTS